jgi:hypothetical protein
LLYYLVPLKDVTQKLGGKDLERMSHSIDKLAYEMLKEYDWMSFYNGSMVGLQKKMTPRSENLLDPIC